MALLRLAHRRDEGEAAWVRRYAVRERDRSGRGDVTGGASRAEARPRISSRSWVTAALRACDCALSCSAAAALSSALAAFDCVTWSICPTVVFTCPMPCVCSCEAVVTALTRASS